MEESMSSYEQQYFSSMEFYFSDLPISAWGFVFLLEEDFFWFAGVEGVVMQERKPHVSAIC